jgi:predicted enzyme related to lactoylglutathione lyase
MSGRTPRLAGVELYFDDLAKGTRFYRDTLEVPLPRYEPSPPAYVRS